MVLPHQPDALSIHLARQANESGMSWTNSRIAWDQSTPDHFRFHPHGRHGEARFA